MNMKWKIALLTLLGFSTAACCNTKKLGKSDDAPKSGLGSRRRRAEVEEIEEKDYAGARSYADGVKNNAENICVDRKKCLSLPPLTNSWQYVLLGWPHVSWPKSYSQQAVRKGQHIVELSHSDYH